MKFHELEISGVWAIDHGVFGDSRGELERIFDEVGFQEHGITTDIEHSLISSNPVEGTLRGFHFQTEPFVEAKTITCLTGSIYDVVVDLRIDSSTFCEWVSVELSAEGHSSLHVPKGCANAWITTAPHTNLHYYMATAFSAGYGRGFRYDDPEFEANWPMQPTVISARDLHWPPFDRARDGIRL